MAISSMAKILIACHKSQVSPLLETLQQSGISQILNAEEAMVSKHYPDLETAGDRPREIEEKLSLTARSVTFLARYADTPRGLAAVLAPKVVIDKNRYDSVTKNDKADELVTAALDVESKIEKLLSEIENVKGAMSRLRPWAALETEVEELAGLQKTTCLAGLLPNDKLVDVNKRLKETEAAIEQAGSIGTQLAILVVCLKDNASNVQKLLRSADFESANFEGLSGTVAELINENENKLAQMYDNLKQQQSKAKELAADYVKVQILHDHYLNLLNREQMASDCPATERTVILEGWVRKKELQKLEGIISQFDAAQLNEVVPAEDEKPPVEIENRHIVKPFEVVTRLYGMPENYSVDPTVFLAPFFALFFGICLTDAGYGLMLLIGIAFFIPKMQGDKKLLWMLIICSLLTVVAGALTGGWLGDAIQQFIPALEPFRQKTMWFDPLQNPMMFFMLSLALGYIQILTGLVIAFFHNLLRKDYAAAVFDQLTWLVLLNSVVVVIFVGGKAGEISGYIALVPAAMILFFSQRQGGLGARLGMGLYNLFSSIFYMGDVLSYLRLMALGMVTAGMAMAINIIAKIALDIPYGIGIILAILILVCGHVFNMAFSALSAFVHTLRLQYAEFFPKFFTGGGREFRPLRKNYKYVQIKTND